MLIGGSSRCLFLWLSFMTYVQLMAYEVQINPWCFIWVLGEYFNILLEESHQLDLFYW